ncbi:MAG TPA: hypothetical protein VF803_02040 [Candidatus Paceibacterota bacterium]
MMRQNLGHRFIAPLLIVLVMMMPMHTARAGGIVSAVSDVVSGVVGAVGDVVSAVSDVVSSPIGTLLISAALMVVAPELGAAITDSVAEVVGNTAASLGFDPIVALTTTQDVLTGVSMFRAADAAVCLGTGSSFTFSGCSGGGSSGGGAYSSSVSSAQGAIDANSTVVSNATQSGTCPSGYSVSGNQCIPDGYLSCAPIGHPETACPDTSQCVINSDGSVGCQSQTATAGNTCDAKSGTSCTTGANSCGMSATGKYLCDGTTCSALTPLDSQCTAPSITLGIYPSMINPGNSCQVRWSVTNATYCSLSSDIGDSVASTTLPKGSYDTPPLTTPATYTMLCHNGKTVTSQETIKCPLNPVFKQI